MNLLEFVRVYRFYRRRVALKAAWLFLTRR